jgi:hypothetical protein
MGGKQMAKLIEVLKKLTPNLNGDMEEVSADIGGSKRPRISSGA